MAEWTEEHVLAWCGTELPQWAAGVQLLELNGLELASMVSRSLLKLLAAKDATDPAAAGRELLARRNSVLAEQRSRSGGPGECGVCLEEYDMNERFPRIFSACGHSFCALDTAKPAPRLTPPA